MRHKISKKEIERTVTFALGAVSFLYVAVLFLIKWEEGELLRECSLRRARN